MQTSYSANPAPGVVGAVATGGIKPVIESRIADGVCRPGQYVVFGPNGTCKHPTAAVTALTKGGLVIRKPYGINDGAYADKEPVDVLVEGEMFCGFEAAITELAAVFVRHVAGGGEQLGALRHDVDGTDAVAVSGLRTKSAGTALVKVEVKPAA